MASLIETLNANATKTPDQIAEMLKAQDGILYFDTMTFDQAEHMGNGTECALFKWVEGAWRLDETEWEFWGEDEEVSYFNRQLWNYACIEMENYYDGLLPNRAPQRTGR